MIVDPLVGSAIIALMGGGGAWAFLSAMGTARSKQPADMMMAQAAYQDALTKQGEVFSSAILQLVTHQGKEIIDLRAEVGRLAAAERDCRDENHQLHQKVDSLVNRLRAAGVGDLPAPAVKPAGTFAKLDAGKVTLYQDGTQEEI